MNKYIVEKYIKLMYSFNAESRKKYMDYMERKRECAIEAGFEFDEKFVDEVEDMLIGKDDKVNQQIIDFLIEYGSPDLVRYVSYQEMLAKQAMQAMGETDEKKIKVVVENMDNISSKIKELEIELFGGEDKSLRKSLYSTMKLRIRLRPEAIAKDIKDKKLAVRDFYYDK